jgi:hypothetical protein
VSDAGFVAGAWTLAGATLALYTGWLVRRLARAERSLGRGGASGEEPR